MKRVTLIILVLFSILFSIVYMPHTHATIEHSFEVTVVKGNNDIVLQNIPSISSQFGSTISIDVSGLVTSEKAFAYYILNGERIDSQSLDFIVSSSTNLIIVMSGEDEFVATFIDTNGELLYVDYVTYNAPNYQGPIPEKPGYTFIPFGILPTLDDHNVFVAAYTLSNLDKSELSITYANLSSDLLEVDYNSIVTLNATSGSNFSHWADQDDTILSVNPEFKFSALKSSYTIVEKTGDIPSESNIYLSNVTGIRNEYYSFLGRVEDGYIEFGIALSTTLKLPQLGESDTIVITSQSLHPVTKEFLRSVYMDDYIAVRAYGILPDGTVHYSNLITLSDVIYISQESQLRALANNQTLESMSMTYVLMNDIELSEETSGMYWTTPIGTDALRFNGIFEGNGFTIYNVKNAYNTIANFGFFGYVGTNGVVRNLILDTNGILYVGTNSAVFAQYNFGLIENAMTFGEIRSTTTSRYTTGFIRQNNGVIRYVIASVIISHNEGSNVRGAFAVSTSGTGSFDNALYNSEIAGSSGMPGLSTGPVKFYPSGSNNFGTFDRGTSYFTTAANFADWDQNIWLIVNGEYVTLQKNIAA